MESWMCSLWNMDTWNLVVKFCAHVVYIFVLWHGWISLTLWTSGERLMPSKTGSTRRRTIACFECAYSELMKQIFFKLKRVKRSSWITILLKQYILKLKEPGTVYVHEDSTKGATKPRNEHTHVWWCPKQKKNTLGTHNKPPPECPAQATCA